MPVEFIFMYLMIDVFCLFFSLVIYSKISIDMGTEREVRALRLFVIAFCVFLVVDAVWAMGTYGVVPMSEAAVGIIEMMTLLIMGFVAYFWFLYAENRMNVSFVDSNLFTPFAAIPVVVVVILYLLTPVTGWICSVGPGAMFIKGPFADVPLFVFLSYVAFITVHALIFYVHETSSMRRREFMTLVMFAVPPVVCGIIDWLMHGMPVMALSVFASLLLVFMNEQTSRVNTDTLTGLNNRRRATEYIEGALSDLEADDVFGVFMIDADYFKEINDQYGHSAGDRALQIIAEGMRCAIANHHGLAARWGGDEFLMATYLEPGEQPASMKDRIEQEIDAACDRSGVEYRIAVSVGYALANVGDAVSAVVDKADQALYRQKELTHSARA